MEALHLRFGLRRHRHLHLHLHLLALSSLALVVACGSVVDETGKPTSSPPSSPPTTSSTGEAPPAPPAPPTTVACDHAPLTEQIAREGATPVAAVHNSEKACTFTDYDTVGVVMKIVRTVDANKHFATENMDRLDEPPRDTDHDGVFGVPPRKTRRVFQSDAKGQLTNETIDEDGDGTIDTTRWWAFDAGGREVTAGLKWGSAPDAQQSVTTRTFDAGGHLLTETIDRTGELIRKSTFTRRVDGAPLTYEYRHGANLDSSASWIYDANDTATKRELSSIRTTTTIVDKSGRMLEHREDQPKDGVDDYIRQISYTPAGSIIRDHAFGTNGEEYGDLVQTFDPQGRVVQIWKRWGFGQTKGPTTDVEQRQYDACGQVVSIQRTQNGAAHSSVARTYDPRGYLLVEEEHRLLPTKSPASKTSRTFDAQGRLSIAITEDADPGSAGGWKVSSKETRSYDAAGHLIEVVTVSTGTNGGATTNRREAWSYDAKGDLLLHERTAFKPGSIVREEMDYACLGP